MTDEEEPAGLSASASSQHPVAASPATQSRQGPRSTRNKTPPGQLCFVASSITQHALAEVPPMGHKKDGRGNSKPAPGVRGVALGGSRSALGVSRSALGVSRLTTVSALGVSRSVLGVSRLTTVSALGVSRSALGSPGLTQCSFWIQCPCTKTCSPPPHQLLGGRNSVSSRQHLRSPCRPFFVCSVPPTSAAWRICMST